MTAFIDTNVLIYAHGDGAKSETARQVVLASALDTGCDTLLTKDLQAGPRVDGLSIVNPFV